jgi:hypothetical protein
VPRRNRQTCITPGIVADPDRVGEAIDEILHGNRELERIHGQIIRRQRDLRAVIDDAQWRAYMGVEELFNQRWALTLEVVARTFYRAGRRARKAGR